MLETDARTTANQLICIQEQAICHVDDDIAIVSDVNANGHGVQAILFSRPFNGNETIPAGVLRAHDWPHLVTLIKSL